MKALALIIIVIVKHPQFLWKIMMFECRSTQSNGLIWVGLFDYSHPFTTGLYRIAFTSNRQPWQDLRGHPNGAIIAWNKPHRKGEPCCSLLFKISEKIGKRSTPFFISLYTVFQTLILNGFGVAWFDAWDGRTKLRPWYILATSS